MKIENSNFQINYNECDKAYISELIGALNQNLVRIMHFFNISELRRKKVIKLWSNLDEYTCYLKPYVGEYQSWMVADTFNKDINILSYNLYLCSEGHKNGNMSDYKKIIIHEFVYACQQEINSNAANVFWFWEALAANLSEQKYSVTDILYSKDELMHDFTKLKYAYSTAYTIGKLR